MTLEWPEWVRRSAYNIFVRRNLTKYQVTKSARYYPWLLTAPCGCRMTCERLKCGDERVTVNICKEHD